MCRGTLEVTKERLLESIATAIGYICREGLHVKSITLNGTDLQDDWKVTRVQGPFGPVEIVWQEKGNVK